MPATSWTRLALAAAVLAAAATLGGCAARPFSIEEKRWFDRAITYDLGRDPWPRYAPSYADPGDAPRYPR